MKKRKMVIVVAAVMSMILAACSFSAFASEQEASDLDAIKEKGVIVVGITDFAPMDYKDDNGEWIGFDADLARMFAEEIGVDVEFQEIDWDGKILELNAGTVDCIWNGMTLTEEVGNAMECTITYALNAQVVVLPSAKLADFQDEESLKGLSIAAEAGSAGEAVGQELELNINSVQSQAAALMEVAAGTSDACIIDKTMADAMTGEGTSYADLGYELSLSSEEYVVGFRKGSDAAIALDEMFAKWILDGTLKELSEKYDNAVSVAEIDLEEVGEEIKSAIEGIISAIGAALEEETTQG